MGRMKDLLLDFEDIWSQCEAAAKSGIEADLVTVVGDPGVLDMFVSLCEENGAWHLKPHGWFSDPSCGSIPVSPDFRDRLEAYIEASREDEFMAWVDSLEHAIRTGAYVVPGEVC